MSMLGYACIFRFLCFDGIALSRSFDQGLISPVVTAPIIMPTIKYFEEIPVSSDSEVDRVHLFQPRVMIAILLACDFALHVVLLQKGFPIAKTAVSDMLSNLDRNGGHCRDIEDNYQVRN
jgi:preprotein translocase subunit SecY